MESVIYGFLGADAKETEKGFSFSISDKFKENGEEKTLWITCFYNHPNKVMEYLKKGTPLIVYGEVNVSVYKRGEGDYIPSVICYVSKIRLTQSNNKQAQ